MKYDDVRRRDNARMNAIVELLPKDMRVNAMRVLRHGPRPRRQDESIIKAIREAEETLDDTRNNKPRIRLRQQGKRKHNMTNDSIIQASEDNLQQAAMELGAELAGQVEAGNDLQERLVATYAEEKPEEPTLPDLPLLEALERWKKNTNAKVGATDDAVVVEITIRTTISKGLRTVRRATKYNTGFVYNEVVREEATTEADEEGTTTWPVTNGRTLKEVMGGTFIADKPSDVTKLPVITVPPSSTTPATTPTTTPAPTPTTPASTSTTPATVEAPKRRASTGGEAPKVPKHTLCCFVEVNKDGAGKTSIASKDPMLLQNWLDRRYGKGHETIQYVAGEGWDSNRLPEDVKPKRLLDRFELGMVK